MPELPEVETVRLGLIPHLEGQVITKAGAFSRKLRLPIPEDFAKKLTGRRIIQLHRRAKYILIDMAGGLSVILHLGMSGQILISRFEANTPFKPAKHDHFFWETAGGMRLVYHDPRRFGLVAFSKTDNLPLHPLIKNLGVEPLSNAFNGPALKAALVGKTCTIKAALLDQRTIAGLGNIYVSEALYRAHIHPTRKAGSVSLARIETLVAMVRAVLREALKSGGSSLKDYVRVNGELGYFQHHFDVYDRAGRGCRSRGCGGAVRRIVQNARSTFYCPRCQT